MATKLFCDKCWNARVRNESLADDNKAMPTKAAYSVVTPTGSKQDTCSTHLLETIQDALNTIRNNDMECTIRKLL